LAAPDALLTVKRRFGLGDFKVSFSEAVEDFAGDVALEAADSFGQIGGGPWGRIVNKTVNGGVSAVTDI
jgi:hypothetical protein